MAIGLEDLLNMPPKGSPEWRLAQWNRLARERQGLEPWTQFPEHFGGASDPFTDFLDVAAPIALGSLFFGPVAGAASSGGAGAAGAMSEGAAWGAGLEGTADLAAMQAGAGMGAGSTAASMPIDWSSATAGGVADTGFGASTVPLEGFSSPLAGVPRAPVPLSGPASVIGEGGMVSAGVPAAETLGLNFAAATPTSDLGEMSSPTGGTTTAPAPTGATAPMSAPTGTLPDAGYDLGGYGTTPVDSAIYTDPGLATAGASPDLLARIKDAYSKLKDPISMVGALGQMYQGNQQANKMEEYLKSQQAKDDASRFPYRQYDQFAADFMDPAKRYQMMLDNPAFKRSEEFLINQQQRKLAGQGKFGQIGQGGALSNNWAVPMADVVAKNAMDWEKNLFGQIQGVTGMNMPGRNDSAQLAGGFLPAIYNTQQDSWRTLGDAMRRNQGFLPEVLKATLA